jgi:hypothetical protein
VHVQHALHIVDAHHVLPATVLPAHRTEESNKVECLCPVYRSRPERKHHTGGVHHFHSHCRLVAKFRYSMYGVKYSAVIGC